jgi:hypothetical protein
MSHLSMFYMRADCCSTVGLELGEVHNSIIEHDQASQSWHEDAANHTTCVYFADHVLQDSY